MKEIYQWRKTWIAVLFFVLLIVGGRAYYSMTADFRPSSITYDIPEVVQWKTPPLSAEDQALLEPVLREPFHFIGKGAQMYAFESKDGKYVLKFFKFKHLRPSWWFNWVFPLPSLENFRLNSIARKRERLESVFNGYYTAYTLDKEETGLVYLHLDPSVPFPYTVQLVDKIGFEWEINLQNLSFVIQKKGKTLRHVIRDALDAGDIELAQKRLRQIIDLYNREYAKGIYDRDHGVMHNTGFVGDTPIHLDIGKLSKSELTHSAEFRKHDLNKVLEKMRGWLKKHYPEQSQKIIENIDEYAAKSESA